MGRPSDAFMATSGTCWFFLGSFLAFCASMTMIKNKIWQSWGTDRDDQLDTRQPADRP